MEPKKEHINVSVRVRPFLNQDNTSSSSLQIISTEPPVLLVIERSQSYHFDNIFSEDADQEKIYNDAVKPFVDYVKKGYNCTVFAYGQTGTGKTYTMGSGSQKPFDKYHTGIIPRALEQLFDRNYLDSDEEIDVYVSFSEIYNERVFDLLQPNKKCPLPVSGFIVQGLSIKNVRTVAEAKELLEIGNKNRHVGETKQNSNSSRSHAIFTVYFSLKNSSQEVNGKLNLVDLAGSESVKKTGSKGSTLQEGININKGLLCIGQVISALSTKSNYVPYRQSMITSILQGSLNVDNYISLIACVSANPDDITETLQTLDFAQRTKKVRSNPEVNQVIAKYKKENPNSFGSVRTPMKRLGTTPLKTPAFKKMIIPLLPLINESTQSQISNTDSSRSQCSINISSVSSRISPVNDITQQTLSPVIRKYMTKMEVSIMDRLETVISTLQRPTRVSMRSDKSRADIEKENTPKLHWNNIQNEVSKMVRNEIAQMSAKTVKIVRATSSPIEDKEQLTARRLLKYDSPETLQHSGKASDKSTPADESQRNFSFKVPDLPPEKKKRGRRSKMSISPIENEMPIITPRRSLRLSMKNADNDNNNILNVSEVSFDSNIIDRPLKVMSEDTEPQNDISTSSSTYVLKDYRNNQNDYSDLHNSAVDDSISCTETSLISRSQILQKLRGTRNKAKQKTKCCETPGLLHNQRKSIGFKITKTPSKILAERALKKYKSKDSPYTAHSKKVLNILNKGNHREIEKLHLIGAKSAEQILLFRKLKGSFNELEDLSKVPGWGAKKYEKFVTLNFLRKD